MAVVSKRRKTIYIAGEKRERNLENAEGTEEWMED